MVAWTEVHLGQLALGYGHWDEVGKGKARTLAISLAEQAWPIEQWSGRITEKHPYPLSLLIYSSTVLAVTAGEPY